MKATTKAALIAAIKKSRSLTKRESAWFNGVKMYAVELVDGVDCDRWTDFISCSNLRNEILLNGASSWRQYSWGGCALVYNGDICDRLCAPYEKKLTRDGIRKPNQGEDWLDVQARALWQAQDLINRVLATV